MRYADLLKILDPFNYDMPTVSRYHNLQLTAEQIIITSPFSPIDFYEQLKSVSIIDGRGQLLRRIALTIEVTPDSLNEVEFSQGKYVVVASRPNPYFDSGQTAKKFTLNDAFEEMEGNNNDD